MQSHEPTTTEIALKAAAKIETAFEAYETALKTLKRLTDDLSLAFESDTEEFDSLLRMLQGFDAHATEIECCAGEYERLAAAAKIAPPVVRT